MLKNILCVFIGGGLGSLVRYGISLKTNMLAGSFPVATLVSNTVACAIIGVLTGYFFKTFGQCEQRNLAFVVGDGFLWRLQHVLQVFARNVETVARR
jgi:fluoride exporter